MDNYNADEVKNILIEIARKCDDMPNFVFQYYSDYTGRKNKQFYNLIADAFKDLQSYSLLMLNACWSQAAVILRVAIERISKIVVLCERKELINKFTDMCFLQSKYYYMSKEDQKKFQNEHNMTSKKKITDFFDYGWAKDICPEGKYDLKAIIKLARLDETLVDRDNTLNPFAHGSLTIFQFCNHKEGWKLMKRQGIRMNMIAINLFNFLFVSIMKVMNENISYTPLDELHEKILDFLNIRI